MAFETKVRALGGGLWIQLPDRLASQLGVEEGDPVYLTESGSGGFRLTSAPEGGAAFLEQMKVADGVIKRHAAALRELAR